MASSSAMASPPSPPKASPPLPSPPTMDSSTTAPPDKPPHASSVSEPTGPSNIERLGRQRPASLVSPLQEIAFVATIVLSMMMSEFFIGGFNIILPPLVSALNIPPAAATWPAGVTNLTTAALIQPFARLCDMYGARGVFFAGHAWLLVWSIAAGFSQEQNLLIVCRAMQGIGAAAFLPAGLALLSRTYRPGPRKNVAFAIYGAFACLGFYFGILVGALTAQLLDWRWYFWIGAVLVAVVAAAGILSIPRDVSTGDAGASMDWWGMCTIVPGLVLVVFALTDGRHAPRGWSTPYVYVTLVVGVLFLVAAVYVEGWVAAQPLLPPALFKPKYMVRLVCALFCAYGVFGLFLFYASFQIENTMHKGPLLTAAWFTPFALGGIVLALCGGLVLHLVSNRALLLTSCLGFLATSLLLALMPRPDPVRPSSHYYWAFFFPAMLGATLGVDVCFNVTNVYITTAMPRRHQAAASGLINSLLYLGVAFWLGIAELAVSLTEESGPLDQLHEYRIGFWTGVALAVVMLALTLSLKMDNATAGLTADEKAELEAQQSS